ncbi:MAG: glycosyltransferase family 2 protein [Prevotella sp.]|nr:glycosyltransferase family 2 protein [Prevotella sp.]
MDKSRQQISVVINTYNAARHLERVLCSVSGFDEVVVCDMESTDDTVDIARRHGCRVVTFPKAGHVSAEPARTFAIQSATRPWVLVVDADELVPPELRERLYRHISQHGCASGLYLPRQNLFMGRPLRCAWPDYQLRFFVRQGTVWPPYVHTFPVVKGRVERLPAVKELALGHLADDSIHTIMEKDNRYSDDDVMKKADRHYGVWALLWRPTWRFTKCYLLEGGWRDGVPGLVYAGLKAIYQFELVAKIIEKNRRAET